MEKLKPNCFCSVDLSFDQAITTNAAKINRAEKVKDLIN